MTLFHATRSFGFRQTMLLTTGCFALVALGVSVIALVSRNYTQQGTRQTETLTGQFLPGLVTLDRLQDAALNLKSNTYQLALAKDEAAMKAKKQAFQASSAQVDLSIAELKLLAYDEPTQQLITAFAAEVQGYRESAEKFQTELRTGEFEKAMATLDQQIDPAQHKIETQLQALNERYFRLSRNASARTTALLVKSDRVGLLATVVLVVFTLLCLGLSLVATRALLAQMQRREAERQAAQDTLEERVRERTEELENVYKQLLETSRQAGMAEVATSVLHNVGNVLNSVNISASMAVDKVRNSKASSLVKVVALLRDHEHDLGTFITSDSRGRHVPEHLARLSDHLVAEQGVIVDELESLRRNVEHIKEIVAMQQNYAMVGGVTEMINVVTLVEDSLRMNEGGLNRHGVEIIREFEDVPLMNVEKHKILQILVNLLRNAKHACQDSERPDKRLTVRVANGGGRVRISVTDNGVGIAPENLTRIYHYGFTTRKDGHGFGLHSGALAAKEMGGSLTAHSDGPGTGAAFTLDLPCPIRKDSHE